eukprot:403363669
MPRPPWVRQHWLILSPMASPTLFYVDCDDIPQNFLKFPLCIVINPYCRREYEASYAWEQGKRNVEERETSTTSSQSSQQLAEATKNDDELSNSILIFPYSVVVLTTLVK